MLKLHNSLLKKLQCPSLVLSGGASRVLSRPAVKLFKNDEERRTEEMNALSLGNGYALNGPEKSSLRNCMDFEVLARTKVWLIHIFYIQGVSWPADSLSNSYL